MIVSELIQHSRQHAFPDGRGSIKVELTHNDAAANCRIADNGRAYAENHCARAMTIVYALAGHLHATLGRSSGPGGTTWIITVPRRTRRDYVSVGRKSAAAISVARAL